MEINSTFARYTADHINDNTIIFCGGRRSGKTYFICQWLLLHCAKYKRIANVATMTQEQGRLGAFADMCNIIVSNPALAALCTINQSPRELRFANGSRIFFNSYQNSETAKGIACDYLFINEANNFSKQQYIDLVANVRRKTFIDFNPNKSFWVNEFFGEEHICRSNWKNNPFLTQAQRDYFRLLKEAAEKPDASIVDVRNYKVYYLGEFCELTGNIFNTANIHKVDKLPANIVRYLSFSDPSAIRGADYFANVLVGLTADKRIVLVDSLSINVGTREAVCKKIADWQRDYGCESYVETNGLVGIDFYEFCINSNIAVNSWYSRGNKFERIVANYQTITEGVDILSTESNTAYLEQCYDFSEKCEHDDNIDALNSAINAARLFF